MSNGDGRMRCWSNIHLKPLVRRHVAAEPKGGGSRPKSRARETFVSRDGDGEGQKICLGGGLSTTPVCGGPLK